MSSYFLTILWFTIKKNDISFKRYIVHRFPSDCHIYPVVVNRTQSTFDYPPNQSNLIECNRSIVFRLIESIERSSNQSNFPNFFVIDSIAFRLHSIAIRLHSIAIRLHSIAIRLHSIAIRLHSIYEK